MDLWIRSQDKEVLVKANALYVMDNQIWNEVPFYENHKKIGLTITGHNHRLAQYKSKERALEVLDEIQNLLQPKLFIKEPKINTDDLIHSMSEYVTLKTTQQVEYDLKQAGQIVYQMPKE